MDLYLIRHAQSENNALEQTTRASHKWEDANLYHKTRSDDPQLTEEGVLQAQSLANVLSQEHDLIEAAEKSNITLYTSPMLRALQTADHVSKALKVKPNLWVDIHEEGGIFKKKGKALPGLNRNDMLKKFPDVILGPEDIEKGWWNKTREGIDDFRIRVTRVVTKLLEMAGSGGPPKVVMLVSHGTFIKYLLSELCGLQVMISQSNMCVNRIQLFPDTKGKLRVRIRYLNRIYDQPRENGRPPLRARL